VDLDENDEAKLYQNQPLLSASTANYASGPLSNLCADKHERSVAFRAFSGT